MALLLLLGLLRSRLLRCNHPSRRGWCPLLFARANCTRLLRRLVRPAKTTTTAAAATDSTAAAAVAAAAVVPATAAAAVGGADLPIAARATATSGAVVAAIAGASLEVVTVAAPDPHLAGWATGSTRTVAPSMFF